MISTRGSATKGMRLRDRNAMLSDLQFASTLVAKRSQNTSTGFAQYYTQLQQNNEQAKRISLAHMLTLIRIVETLQGLPERNGVAGISRLMKTLTITEAKELIPYYLTPEQRITILEAIEDGWFPHKYTVIHSAVMAVGDGVDLSVALSKYGNPPTATSERVAEPPAVEEKQTIAPQAEPVALVPLSTNEAVTVKEVAHAMIVLADIASFATFLEQHANRLRSQLMASHGALV